MPKAAASTRPLFYNLEGIEPKPCKMEDIPIQNIEARTVGRTIIGRFMVSTVFLAIDQATSGPPLLFETMVFKGKDYGSEIHQNRYTTWYEAEKGHAAVCAMINNGTFEKMIAEN